MAISSRSKVKRQEADSKGAGDGPVKGKRRKCLEVRVVGGRIYDPQNGKTCHQCRQKTMDFVAACKNLNNDKPCTFKFCHKCLYNRYGEKAEVAAVEESWSCPKCRGICNCSFCMKKRGHQPTGILIHTARATGFSSVSELLHVNGSENVGVAKIIQGMNMRLTKHTGSSTDRVALSPIKHEENSISENPNTTKPGITKENRSGKKRKQEGLKDLQDNNNSDVNQDDVALLMEINARMTRSGKSKRAKGEIQDKGISVQEAKPSKTQMAKEESKDAHHQKITEIPCEEACKRVSQISNLVSKKVKSSKTVGALEINKELEKRDSKAPPSDKIECRSEQQNLITANKKLANDAPEIEILLNIDKPEIPNSEPQNKEAIAEIVVPKGSELNAVAGIGLKPEDVGHALQFLEFCAAFGKVLNLKKGEPEHVLRELITGGRARRGKVSAVNQFHIHLVTLLQEELGVSPTLADSTNGRTSWLQALKDCTSISQFALEELKLEKFEKGSSNYDIFNSSEKLVLLNFICDELLCTEKLRSWIDDQNTKHCEKVKEAKERVLAAKQKEKHLKQKMQDDIAKAIISKNGGPLSISEHDAIISQIKTESAQAHAEMLEAKGIVPDENKRPEAVRTQPFISDADGHTFWRLKGHSGQVDILLLDVGTWDGVGSGEKWFMFNAEQEKEIDDYICSLRKNSSKLQVTSKPSTRARRGLKAMADTSVP